MFKRLTWLLVSAVLPMIALWAVPGVIQSESALHDVIINEWSQGNGGSREWVELLVVTDSLDMRDWDLGDSTAGDLTFGSDPFWSSVPVGSLIVVYNAADRDTVLPPDDFDLSDCVAILPHNASGYFSGSWPAFANATTDDNPHLRDAADLTIHNFTAEPGPTLHPDANQNAQYEGNTAVGVSNPANWSNQAASSTTPAAGNGNLNSTWVSSLCDGGGGGGGTADLTTSKTGPPMATAGNTLVYQISLGNNGTLTAIDVVLTDTLPAGLSYVGDDSGLAMSQPNPQTLVWQVGTVPTTTSLSFNLTATVTTGASGQLVNTITAVTAITETNTANNTATASTFINSSSILIDAVHYYGYESDADEAVALRNMGSEAADLSNWKLSDGASTATIPPDTLLAAGQVIWLAKEAVTFSRHFGFLPTLEVVDSDPAVPQMSGSWPGFSNNGDEVLLFNASDDLADVLVYGDGDTTQVGWSGVALQPYSVSNIFAVQGQILYRRRDQATGLPVPDSHTTADWAQMIEDVINGRKVMYPGWDLDSFFFTTQVTETAVLTVAIAPDNAYETIVQEINAAQNTIQIEALTFENVAIGEALMAAVQRGVSVTVLLEGAPPGGLPNQEKYICQELETVGGQCWFMISDETADIYDRYRFLHAKFILIDGQKVVISSENLSPNSLPDDDKSDGTWGRRGVVLITDAPGVINHVQTIFDLDFDTAHHLDLFRWEAGHDTYGPPPLGFVPITVTGGTTYTVRYPDPLRVIGTFAFEVVQSPENSLRDQGSLIGLVNRAGVGDNVWVMQLEERPYWGSTTSNPVNDPNPRLEAYLAAARRGANVRLLLDQLFDDPASLASNLATCYYVNQMAQIENLDLECALGNPAGLGIHNKMVLVQVNGQGYIHVGSLNGTEQASKGNRELALQVQSNEAYALLATMFDHDWPYRLYLPLMFNHYIGPANHLLISEVLYDPFGTDDAEFVELYNPMNAAIDLSNFALGDAVNTTDFEDVRRFPVGTILPPGETLVVATSATAFYTQYAFNPDFEIISSDTAVPDLIDDPAWGDPNALFQLGNAGDEVILRDSFNQAIDVVVYGDGIFPGVVACGLVTTSNHSLERYPPWRDTDDCSADFRDWPFPNPGTLP